MDSSYEFITPILVIQKLISDFFIERYPIAIIFI